MKLSYQEQLTRARGAVDVYREVEHERIVNGSSAGNIGWRLALQSILAGLSIAAGLSRSERSCPVRGNMVIELHFTAIIEVTEERFAARVREVGGDDANEMAHDQNFGWSLIGRSLVDAYERLVPPEGDG